MQWCGLVYADALYWFLEFDPDGPWRRLADGITASALQQTWPLADPQRQGLLPDSFQLRSQQRTGPAINPATVLVLPAIRYFGEPLPYELRAFLRYGLRAHVPGQLRDIVERADGLDFTVETWSPKPSRLFINGVWHKPAVKINGAPTLLDYPHQYQKTEGRLVLCLEKSARVELEYPATAALRIKSGPEPGSLEILWPEEVAGFGLEVYGDLVEPTWRPVDSDPARPPFALARQQMRGQEYFRLSGHW